MRRNSSKPNRSSQVKGQPDVHQAARKSVKIIEEKALLKFFMLSFLLRLSPQFVSLGTQWER
jgi:hypothetical protein